MSKSNSKKNTQPAVKPVEVEVEAQVAEAPIEEAKKPSKKAKDGVSKSEKKAKVGFLGNSSQGAARFSPGTHPRAIRQAQIDEAKKTELESPEKKI